MPLTRLISDAPQAKVSTQIPNSTTPPASECLQYVEILIPRRLTLLQRVVKRINSAILE